ncbi:hypothetical protein FACS189462_0450 [Spirochaetia bacterium]|nr:hypothetical protein FACS189462_0450 [Spirochaetia bacterium]
MPLETYGFQGHKNVPEKNPTKGEARLGFCGGQAATAAQRIAYVMCSKICDEALATDGERVSSSLLFFMRFFIELL